MRFKNRTVYPTYATVLCAMALGSIAAGENISLSASYPKEQLRKILIPRKHWRPFPKANDRAAWAAVPKQARETFIGLAGEYLQKDVPNLPATLYLEYKRIGNRSNYQDVWFERRKMLHCLVVAECVEGKGRFLDAIANVLWAICEESSWTFPAHIGRQKAGVGLPDTAEPIVALFSAQTANSLAWTVYLLQEQLDNVSPIICERVEREVDARILTPYLRRDDFGWMAFAARRDGRRPNNWNPWVNSNVLASALLLEADENRRLEIVHKVLRCLDNFLVPYPSDGSCDEGPSYWGHAGGSLFDNLELLYSATDGQFDLYDNDTIREIGRFIYRTHIVDDYFVSVGDCDARIQIYRDLVFRYGRRIKDPNMQALATYQLTEEALFSGKRALRSLERLLRTLFGFSDLSATAPSSAPMLRDVWLADKDMQLMVARDKQGSSDGLYIACWGSHNGQSHNHNDVGNFIIYVDGRPFIIDVGRPTYTRKTFSSRRYEIWAMQSAYHNLPTINGAMQEAGRQYAARDVGYKSDDRLAELRMDIAPSYSPEARVVSWIRTVRLNRGKNVEIVDSFHLKEVSGDIVLNLLTPCEISRNKPGRMMLRHSATNVQMFLEYDPDKLVAGVEAIDMNDPKLLEIWGSNLYRIGLMAKRAAARDTWTLRFSKHR